MHDLRIRCYDKAEQWQLQQIRRKRKQRRVLVIGDQHTPFMLYQYPHFLKYIYDKYNCNEVVNVGDMIDNHYSSFHEADPDGHSAGDELKRIDKQIRLLADYFPAMKICTGNHDAIPARKAFSAGLAKSWVKTPKEMLIEKGLKVDGWNFAPSFTIDGVFYTHGTGRKARQRARQDMQSIVQGHYHSESYIEHFVGKTFKNWCMQVGCGIDDKSYAFQYGKEFSKSHINCGVILENGELPFLEYMDLKFCYDTLQKTIK